MKDLIEKLWETSILPAMKTYISIPALSPAFSSEWEVEGHLLQSLEIVQRWCRDQNLSGLQSQIIKEPGRTPLLWIEIPPTTPDIQDTILFYGHLDKQPETEGWDDNKGPWTPVIENERLYGRGCADDGYAIFTTIAAIKAVESKGYSHGRCLILIETCEESGSWDLEYYLEKMKEKIGTPDLIFCLDSGANDYQRMWITTSLRGMVSAELHASLLTQSVHSGESGKVASSFRVLRQLLDRIEDAKTGQILIDEFHVEIPQDRNREIQKAAEIIGLQLINNLPLQTNAETLSQTPAQLLRNSTWKPMLSYTGAAGLPEIANAGNMLRPYTALLLSIRTPPTLDSKTAAETLKKVVEADAPYHAKVELKEIQALNGWNMPAFGDDLLQRVENAAQEVFGTPACYTGEGGSIPLINLLSEMFPKAKFIITGVLGPQSNAHGPNESLHIPYVKKLTHAVAKIITAAG